MEKKEKVQYIKLRDCLKSLKRGMSAFNFYDMPIEIEEYSKYAFAVTSNFSKGYLDEDLIYFSIEDEDGLYFAQKGDILISRRNPFRSCIIFIDRKIIVDDNVFILKVDRDVINPFYLIAYIQSRRGQVAIKKQSNDTPTLGKRKLEELMIPLSDDDIQKEAEKYYKDIIERIKKQSKKLRGLYKELFDSIIDHKKNNLSEWIYINILVNYL